jgi:hypothetical protein
MHALRHLHPPTGVVAQPINRSPLYFGAQTKKLSQWFWGSSHQTTDTGFEAQTRKPEATSFEIKLGETVIVVLIPNHWQIVDLGFEAKLKTHAPRLLVHGTDRTQHHPISQSSGHWVPDLCLTIPSPLHQVCYSCHDPCHCPPCRTCQLHTTRQANAILHMKQRYTSRTTEMSQIRIQTSIFKWLITYQTKVLITWLLNLPLDESIDNKKHKVWSSNPKPHETQLEDQKAKKSSRRSSRRRKNCKASKWCEKQQTKQDGKEELRKAQNQNKMFKKSLNSKTPSWNQLPLTLSMQALPIR